MDRFWEKVDRSAGPEGCWLWKAARFKTGYGKFGYKGKTARAHRVSYSLSFGDPPEDLMVCHKCDTPLCVNPAHLYAGTRSQNTLDSIRGGRHKNNLPWSGAGANGCAKLTCADIPIIRGRLARGDRPSAIGRDYGVCGTTIRAVRDRITWDHV